MKKVNAGFGAIAGLIAACSGAIAGGTDYSPAKIVGTYTSVASKTTIIEVQIENSHYVVRLSGGSSAVAGAGVSADCVILARGALKKNVFMADFSAFDTDTFSYSEDQAKAEGRKLQIGFNPPTATVMQADTDGYCGLGANFQGKYHKKKVKR